MQSFHKHVMHGYEQAARLQGYRQALEGLCREPAL